MGKKKHTVIRYTEAMNIGELILKSFARPSTDNVEMRRAYVFSLWSEVVGSSVTQSTRSVFIKEKRLYIELNSSVVRNEIFMLRNDIIRRMNEKAQQQIVEELILR